MSGDHLNFIKENFANHLAVTSKVEKEQSQSLAHIADSMVSCLKNGGKILWCGNGGSAADAQHLAAELIGRFKKERAPVASIALTVDTSILTCVGNDYGFDFVFSRQVEGLMKPQDILVAISTSGNSRNVLEAVKCAKKIGGTVIGFLGNQGGQLLRECDLAFLVPSTDTARIQEMHIFAGHTLCSIIDQHFS